MVNENSLTKGAGFGARVRAYLTQRKMTLTDLSQQTDIPYRTLQAYVQENQKLSAEALFAISCALDASPSILFRGTSEKLDLKAVSIALKSAGVVLKDSDECDDVEIDRLAYAFSAYYRLTYLALRGVHMDSDSSFQEVLNLARSANSLPNQN